METRSTYRLNLRQRIYRFIKAIMDFVIALTALIVLLPLFLVVAVAIKIDSPGPVFFVQKRIGRNGKLFNCVKFRSMVCDAQPYVATFEYKNVQSYITKVGARIRRFSIDELPQLFNVLAFQMSLIGFRPTIANETELDDARKNLDVYQIRPGISGWAQVNGRDFLAANPKKKAEYDAYYLKHLSLWLDIKIFFMTIVKVLKKDGVMEGLAERSTERENGVKIDADTAVTLNCGHDWKVN